MKVKKENLLIISKSRIGLAAGFNILRIGIKSYSGYVTIFKPAPFCRRFFLYSGLWSFIN